MKEYAVYKGEEILAIGTAKELAKKFNVKIKTVRFWTTPANKKRNENNKSKNRKIAIKIEDDEV